MSREVVSSPNFLRNPGSSTSSGTNRPATASLQGRSTTTGLICSPVPSTIAIAQSILLTPVHLRRAEMVMRQTLGRNASRAIRPQFSAVPASRRGLASPSSGSFLYQSGEAAGVKFASRDLAGPTATVALVAKAGTRYQSLPGLAEGLEKYAFRVWNLDH